MSVAATAAARARSLLGRSRRAARDAVATRRRRAAAGRLAAGAAGLDRLDRLDRPVVRPGVRAVVVATERLRLGLAPEWDQVVPDPADPTGGFDPAGPDAVLPDGAACALVLVEAGAAALPGWTATAPGGSGLRATPALAALLDRARERGVPTVLWVTAPGPEAAAAALELGTSVDRVATVDPATVPAWTAALGSDRVVVLGPAAQPRQQNPAVRAPEPIAARRPEPVVLVLDDPGDALDGAAALAAVAAPTLRAVGGFAWPSTDAAPAPLPEPLSRLAVEPLPADRLAGVPARALVALDGGRPGRSVPSWRVVEAGAAATPVVTTPYADPAESGIDPRLAGALVVAEEPTAYRRQVTAHASQPELRDRSGLRLQRAVLDAHTYGHRVDALLGRSTPVPSISAVVPTNRPGQVDAVLANLARQVHPRVELVLVLHGLDLDRAEVAARARAAGVEDVQVLAADGSLTLGACLSLGVSAASGSHVAKMDDDNSYGPHYLSDLVRAFSWTDAGVVGKWAHYVWLEASGAVVLRYPDAEHCYTRLVQGGSMLMTADVVRGVGFADLPRAVDTDFLTRAQQEGVRTYASDRFSYVSVRRATAAGHTWKVTDAEILVGSARLAFFGDPRPHVDV